MIRVWVERGTGIEIRCEDPRVPKDESNTCYRVVERAMAPLGARGRVVIEIEKHLPVQGGLGGASGNAVASLLALERTLKKGFRGPRDCDRVGGRIRSATFPRGWDSSRDGHGEEVYPLPDLPSTACVVATPEIGVSTPQAFADWDAMTGNPQGLKPSSHGALFGTAKAVPFHGGVGISGGANISGKASSPGGQTSRVASRTPKKNEPSGARPGRARAPVPTWPLLIQAIPN